MDILGYEFMEDRLYDKEHCWLKKDGDNYRVGATDFFQRMANEIVFVELPAVGRTIETGKPYASVESGKWVGRVKSSFNGAVVKSNSEVGDFPYLLNESPYDEGWMIEMKPSDDTFKAGLFDITDPKQKEEFEKFLLAEKERIASLQP